MTVEISSLSLPSNGLVPGTSCATSMLVSTNRLRAIPSSQIRSDPVRVFEVLSSVGEIQQIDFSHAQVEQVVLVTYFDLRAARRALVELRGDFKSIEPDSTYDSSTARSVRIKRDSNLSLDDTMSALSVYGEIERISFAGADQLVIEFFDTRGPIAVMTALSCNSSVGASSVSGRGAIGGEARRANYSNPPICPGIEDAPAQLSTAGNRQDSVDFDVNMNAILEGIDKRTTLMIRNIPNKYSQKIILRLIDLRFKDKYDFFYLPIDYKHRCNVGYAFINFCEPMPIIEFFKLLNDKKWDKFNSEKICKISYARLQGQDALLEHFKSSSVMQQHKQMRPFFVKGSPSGDSIATGTSAGLLGGTASYIDGSVIESVWSETSQGTTGAGSTSPNLPPLASLNLGTVEGSIYGAVHHEAAKIVSN